MRISGKGAGQRYLAPSFWYIRVFSKDHARSRLTPFCAKRTYAGRPFELKKKVWTISGYDFSGVL